MEAANQVELQIDVTDAAGLGEPAAIALTVNLPAPDSLCSPPIVCFAKPGGGFSRRYFTVDLPGPASGAEADWHAQRGWIFVSVDHLGVGDSTTHHDSGRLDYTVLAAASRHAEQTVLARLEQGTLHERLAPIPTPLSLGIGQSMGGCLTIVQQGRYHCYDGIAVLGFSAVHTHPPVPPGELPLVAAWMVRDDKPGAPPAVLNEDRYRTARRTFTSPDFLSARRWLFYYDDVDVERFETTSGDQPAPWTSATVPRAVIESVLTPGVIASEAAAVQSPVLVAMGERDVIADPKGEPRAYLSARSVDLFVCPSMGHMHNFASTRELFWQRIDTWGRWVAAHSAAAR